MYKAYKNTDNLKRKFSKTRSIEYDLDDLE